MASSRHGNKLRVDISITSTKPRKQLGSDKRPLIPKPTSSDAFSPTRSPHSNLPKQCHQLVTGSLSSRDCEGHFHLNYYNLHLGFMHSVIKTTVIGSKLYLSLERKTRNYLKMLSFKINTSFFIHLLKTSMFLFYYILFCV